MRRSLPAYLVVAILIASLGMSLALAAPPSSSLDFYAQGVAALQAADYAQAIIALQQAVKQDPNNEPAWFSLGVARAEQASPDLPGALEAFREALKLSPTRAGTRLYIGRIYEAQGAFPEAARVYQDEVRQTQGSPHVEALVALGRAYLLNQMPRDAEAVLQTALDEEPRYVEARYYLGRAQADLHRYPEAIQSYKYAKQVLQDYSDLVMRLRRLSAEEQRERKETEEKLAEDYGRAEDFSQRLGLWSALNKALGAAYLANEQYVEARNAYRGALDRAQNGNPNDPDAYAFVARSYLADARAAFNDEGLLFTAVGILKSAEKSADKALQVDPKSAEAFTIRGEIYLFEADTYTSDPQRGITSHTYDEAIKAFQDALTNRPEQMSAMLGMAQALLRKAQTVTPGSEEAQQALQKGRGMIQQALALGSDRAAGLVLLSQIALEEGQGQEARQFAEQALGLDSQSAEALNAAGLAAYWGGDPAEAVRNLRSATELAPRNPYYHYNLGNAYFQMQSWYMALREYNQALQAMPAVALARTATQRAQILFQSARCYHETQRFSQEIESLNDALALNPAYFEALLQLAQAYAAQEEYRGAQRALDQAVQRTAEDRQISLAKTLSGQIYEMAGDPHSAAAAYSEAVSLDGSNLVAQQALQRLTGQPS